MNNNPTTPNTPLPSEMTSLEEMTDELLLEVKFNKDISVKEQKARICTLLSIARKKALEEQHDYIDTLVEATREKAIKDCIEALKLEEEFRIEKDYFLRYSDAIEDLESLTKKLLINERK